MRPAPLLIVTALVESGTGALLMVWPAVVLALLFGWRQAAPETLVMGRAAGAGVLSIGVASWAARRDTGPPAVLAGVLTYNAVAAAVLLFAGAASGMVGVLLWPAVAYHVARRLPAWPTGGRAPVKPRGDARETEQAECATLHEGDT